MVFFGFFSSLTGFLLFFYFLDLVDTFDGFFSITTFLLRDRLLLACYYLWESLDIYKSLLLSFSYFTSSSISPYSSSPLPTSPSSSPISTSCFFFPFFFLQHLFHSCSLFTKLKNNCDDFTSPTSNRIISISMFLISTAYVYAVTFFTLIFLSNLWSATASNFDKDDYLNYLAAFSSILLREMNVFSFLSDLRKVE